jgi:two-component system LytT family response regulator
MIRTLLIDDERHVRKTLAGLINHFCPHVILVGEADGVESGLQAIRKYKPDLVLLDIKMGDGTGFDLLRKIDSIDFKIIFITAYEQYAVQAFKYSAIDYILKPIDSEDLVLAIDRAIIMMQAELTLRLKALEDNLTIQNVPNKKIVVKTFDNIYLISHRDILCCESDGSYTSIHLKNGNRIVTSKILKEYEDMLSGLGFYRVHKSFLISLSAIDRFEKGDGGFIVLSNGLKIPVASRKREELLGMFDKLK